MARTKTARKKTTRRYALRRPARPASRKRSTAPARKAPARRARRRNPVGPLATPYGRAALWAGGGLVLAQLVRQVPMISMEFTSVAGVSIGTPEVLGLALVLSGGVGFKGANKSKAIAAGVGMLMQPAARIITSTVAGALFPSFDNALTKAPPSRYYTAKLPAPTADPVLRASCVGACANTNSPYAN
jgi:hypothetical protein